MIRNFTLITGTAVEVILHLMHNRKIIYKTLFFFKDLLELKAKYNAYKVSDFSKQKLFRIITGQKNVGR
jgi:hypothetical protein